MGIDILRLPLISYFFDWGNFSGTVIFGILGLSICLIACISAWHQIFSDTSVEAKPY